MPSVGIANYARQIVSPDTLLAEYDAVILAAGSEVPRDLPVKGRDLSGVHFALEFLIPQNKEVAGDGKNPLRVDGKHVVVIGGGDTGSDCVGTSNRHGAASITQIEVMPKPPVREDGSTVWPYWPTKLRTSSSHEEGCGRDWAVTTKEFVGGVGNEAGKLKAIRAARVEWKDGRMVEIAGSDFDIKADYVFLAMGFTNPLASMLDAFGIARDGRGNALAETEGEGCYLTNVPKVFAAGDTRRGQSLIVWAIREGRQCARAVDEFLMGCSALPR
jgi:glutamate synthase (NADPH/NADH) small chain